MTPEQIKLIEKIFNCKYTSCPIGGGGMFMNNADEAVSFEYQFDLIIAAVTAPLNEELNKERRYNAALSSDAEYANDVILKLHSFTNYYDDTNLGGDEQVPILALGNAVDMVDEALEALKDLRNANVLLHERIKALETENAALNAEIMDYYPPI